MEWVGKFGKVSSVQEHEAFERGLVGFEALDEEFARDQLRLGDGDGKTRSIYAERSGHLVKVEEPDVVGKEIDWVLDVVSKI